MPSGKNRKEVSGSEKKALPKSKVIGIVDPKERIEITVLLRPRSGGGLSSVTKAVSEAMSMAAQLPEKRKYITRENFASQRGADPDDLAKVEDFAREHNLTIVYASLARRTVKLAGTIGDLRAAFKVNLKRYRIGNKVFRGRTGAIFVPSGLSEIVVGVLGFDDRPAATPHYRFLGDTAARRDHTTRPNHSNGGKIVAPKKASAPHNAKDLSLFPPQVARLYNFPAGLDGKGQCNAIIELNDLDQHGNITGTGFSYKDLEAYFDGMVSPIPKVVAIGVDGGTNMPGPDPSADAEVMLDIEVAGAVAPGANIAVYFAPNTDQGFINAVSTALHDSIRKPSVISISWGAHEDSWTQQILNAFDQVLQDAAVMGVTVCCASGDAGSSDIQDPKKRDGRPHVDFPAASPFALACGGTRLDHFATTYLGESVWNDVGGATGGGVSNVFPKPSYQSKAEVPKAPNGKVGRGVPDVAGDADPVTGYVVRLVGGNFWVIGGTSAVSPLWAGLITLINQRLASLGKPPAGLINPLIYNATASIFHDIVNGNNDIEGIGKYEAREGWDACTGLGTPIGTKLIAFLGG